MLSFAGLLFVGALIGGQIDAPPFLSATVSRVIDGDTLDAQVDGVRTPVGLLGIEAPALNQPCGPEAVARITELTVDGTLLRQDPAYPGLDARRRVLYYAFTPDGVSIDETLVSEGLARAARPDATDGENLTALERDAQDNARGCLWQ